MDPMQQMAQAVELAREIYEDRTDESGAPHVDHLTRVSGLLREQGAKTETVTVAWLHDLVEDTDLTLDELREMGFSSPVVDAVNLLTRREGQPADDHLTQLRDDEVARAVKHADLTDHLSDEWLSGFAASEREQVRERYRRELDLLGSD